MHPKSCLIQETAFVDYTTKPYSQNFQMSSLSFSTGHEEAVKSSSPLGHGVPEVKVMSQLQSDVVIDATKFRPEAVSEQTARVNKHYLEVFESAPKWYEVRILQFYSIHNGIISTESLLIRGVFHSLARRDTEKCASEERLLLRDQYY